MLEFSVSKDMEKREDIIREVAIGKVTTSFISNTNCQGIENYCRAG